MLSTCTESAFLARYASLSDIPFRAAQYPVTATQWHPEKNAFEWARDLDIPHDKGAIAVTQAVANFVVDEVLYQSACREYQPCSHRHLIFCILPRA